MVIFGIEILLFVYFLVTNSIYIATALVAIIEPDLAAMRYACAGHPPPVIAGPSINAHSLPPGSAPLGTSNLLEPHVQFVKLEPQAVIAFYTDGLTEFGRDVNDGERRLIAAVAALVRDQSDARPAAGIQRAVMGARKPTDDTVLVLLQLTA